VKTIRGGVAAEPESYRPEVLADEEPKYLRRQKPVEIRRRKFGRQSWAHYGRILVYSIGAIGGGFLLYEAWHFVYYSPQVLLARPEQIELRGNHFVGRDAVVQAFYVDRGRSVVRVPLDERRRTLEAMPWVQQASVERIWPNRIRVELAERRPAAFLRTGAELMLVDLDGVILERPAGEEFHFPIVTGLSESLPQEERKRRMQTYDEFLRDLQLVRAGAPERVSEVDLADPKDLRAVLTGLGNRGGSDAVTVHFGEGDFTNKYRLLVEKFPEWQASAGRVESVDLRYQRQIVVNPETTAAAMKPAPQPAPAKPAARPSARNAKKGKKH
jgi:cell division protein FtsQ